VSKYIYLAGGFFFMLLAALVRGLRIGRREYTPAELVARRGIRIGSMAPDRAYRCARIESQRTIRRAMFDPAPSVWQRDWVVEEVGDDE
jgi:hypothetical protein